MRKLPASLFLASFIAVPFAALAADPEPTPEHTLATKVSIYSEYEFRGISQTSEKPAVQLNVDYTHKSGFYLGTFLTNIKWLKDTADVNGFSTKANIEWDIFGGYRFEPIKDVTVDVGYLRYEYPRSKEFNPKPNTDEVYLGATWGPLNAKYSYAFSDAFGFVDSKGSDFIEANLAYPITEKITITGHVGHQRYKKNEAFSYTVYKLGAVYDFGGGFNVGAYYKGTDAEGALYTYKGKDWSKDRLVAFASYSF
jgi:uncharacterized protein (TIGR02001 family)